MRKEILHQQAVQDQLGDARRSFVFDCIFPFISSTILLVGAMAWSKKRISDFKVTFPFRSSNLAHDCREYVFSMQLAKTIRLHDINRYLGGQSVDRNSVIEGIEFLNHLFGFWPSAHLIQRGRALFMQPDSNAVMAKGKDSGKLEFRTGIIQTVHFAGRLQHLTLNDVTAKMFWKVQQTDTALHVAARFLDRHIDRMDSNRLSQKDIDILRFNMKGLKYTFLSPLDANTRRQYTISEIVFKSSVEQTF